MRKQLLLLLFSLFAVMGYARTVTGVVTSEADKQPVIGATVMVQGTSTGTATDFDGKYTINAGDNDVLVFSYVGMETSNIKVNRELTGTRRSRSNCYGANSGKEETELCCAVARF